MKAKAGLRIHAVLLVLAVLCVAGLWEFVGRTERWSFVLPPPSLVLESLWLHADRYFIHSVATLRAMLAGLLLSLVVALPAAWLLSTRPATSWGVHSLIVASQCIPMLVLAPLMVIWLGWTFAAVVASVAFMLVFPLTISLYQGLSSVPQPFLLHFRLWGANSWQLLWRCQVPWALPQWCVGLRIAAGLAGAAALVAEWAGAQQGLGVFMLESRRGADIPAVFAAIVCVTLLNLMLYRFAAILERLAAMRRPFKVICKAYSGRLHLFHALFLTLLLGGISGIPIADPSSQTRELRLILDWMPNPSHIPIYAGIQSGIFQEKGLNLSILKVHEPGDAIPYLTSYQAQLAVTYMPSLVMGAQERGAKIRVAGYLVKEPLNALLVRADAKLDQCVLGCATDGVQTPLLHAILRQNALFPKQVLQVSSDLVVMLLSHQVEAIFGAYWTIEGEHLRQRGLELRCLTLQELGVPRHFELVFVAAKGTLQAQDGFVERFRLALQESIDWCTNHPDEAFDLYVRANPDKTATTLAWERRAWMKTLPVLARNQSDELEVWQTYAQWLANQHLIASPLAIASLFSGDLASDSHE